MPSPLTPTASELGTVTESCSSLATSWISVVPVAARAVGAAMQEPIANAAEMATPAMRRVLVQLAVADSLDDAGGFFVAAFIISPFFLGLDG